MGMGLFSNAVVINDVQLLCFMQVFVAEAKISNALADVVSRVVCIYS